jgi:hypothetical protein
MSWVKLDDGFAENTKIADLSDGAFRLHVKALCRCARAENDGKFSAKVASEMGSSKRIGELVDSGLWRIIPEGYEIKDYLHYNPSRAQLEAKRQATRERLKRYRNDDGEPAGNAVPDEHDSNTNAECNAVTTPSPLPLLDLSSGISDLSKPDPDQPDRSRSTREGGGRRRKSLVGLPDGFAFSAKHAAQAKSKGWPEWWVRNRVDRFCDLAKAKDWRYAEWDRAFYNFLASEIDWKRGPEDLAHLAPKQNGAAAVEESKRRYAERVEAERAAQRARDAAECDQLGLATVGDMKTILGAIGNG